MLSFSSPILLTITLGLVAITIAIALVRKIQMRRLTRVLVACGLVLIGLAAGGPVSQVSRDPRIVVMVDVSPSTRDAVYRDSGALADRARQLLGRAPTRACFFSDRNIEADLQQVAQEIPSERTIFNPPPADAIVLFSDGHFDLPAWAPPTFVVIDRGLEGAPDGRVEWMEVRGPSVAVCVANSGTSRELTSSTTDEAIVIEPGSQVVSSETHSNDNPIRASLNPADRWPENDSLLIYPAPPQRLERWWVGGSAPDNSWIALNTGNLSTDPARYLDVAVVVLDNVPADSLSQSQQDRLTQFVRDLGGGLIILGGDRAFAAGGYPGTALEALSPLSSNPPAPTTHWILLADSSGSMASAVDETTRWQVAAEALVKVLPSIPPDDPVSIGSFARELRWWSQGRVARETATLPLPPRDVAPHGPTNLQPALDSILVAIDGSMPTEVLILSDADTKLDFAALSESMRSKRVRLHLLATAELAAGNPVRRLVEATGGTIVVQADPQGWPDAVRALLRRVTPKHLSVAPVEARFVGALSSLADVTVRAWNHVWPKDQTTPLAVATAEHGQQVLASVWRFGSGNVLAVAFGPDAADIGAMAALVASEPRDPRFKATWTTGRQLKVSIDAIDGDRFMNELQFTLELHLAESPGRALATHPVPQLAPGRYEVSLPEPRSAAVATLLLDGRLVDRRAVAGRYAPEFDAIGTNRDTLRELAVRSGGRVIEPDNTRPIDFRQPRRTFDLTAILAASGTALIALAVIHWRLR